MALPNAFIVGVPKSGTTAVFTSLSRQPNVCASTTKETHFFDPLKYGEHLPPLHEYEALFEPRHDDTALLEATPSYFTGGARIARKLREVAPTGRAAIILREPGARAFSWYRFQRTRLRIPQSMDFDGYLDRCEQLGIDAETTPDMGPWTGLSNGLYAHWLPDWQAAFGGDLLVMYSDDFRADPAAALERIGAHLRIEVSEAVVREQNVSVDVSNERMQKLALRLNHMGERLWRRFPSLKQRLMNTYYKVNARTSQEKMTELQRRRLGDYYADSLVQLRALLPNVPESWGATN